MVVLETLGTGRIVVLVSLSMDQLSPEKSSTSGRQNEEQPSQLECCRDPSAQCATETRSPPANQCLRHNASICVLFPLKTNADPTLIVRPSPPRRSAPPPTKVRPSGAASTSPTAISPPSACPTTRRPRPCKPSSKPVSTPSRWTARARSPSPAPTRAAPAAKPRGPPPRGPQGWGG